MIKLIEVQWPHAQKCFPDHLSYLHQSNMGRRAKYFTSEARAIACKERKAAYEKTELFVFYPVPNSHGLRLIHSRAKVLRSAQNCRAYECRRGPVRLSLRFPTIPISISKFAVFPLPTDSIVFRSYRRSTEPIADDDELLHWDTFPPYPLASDRIFQLRLKEICHALHGRRMRLHHELDLARVKYLTSDTHDDLYREVHRDLIHLLDQAIKLKGILQQFKLSEVDFTMGVHLLQWKARRILALSEDWKALKKGDSDYLRVHAERW